VLKIEGLAKAYGDNQVLKDVSLTIHRGDRLAILGPNGIGKSTLLKIAIGEVKADSGSVEWGYETHPGYFPQDQHEQLQPERETIEAWLWNVCPGEPIGFVRGNLAQVLFSGDEVEKRLGSLSGGEAARLIFAKLAVLSPNVLVLDEPTNHLDLEAIEALVEGLQAYEGTLIFVSHDRWFVGRLADRILEITRDGFDDYPGTFADYVAHCGDDHLDVEAVVLKARREKRRSKQAKRAGDGEQTKRRRALTRERDRLTEEIEKAEARIHEINEIFCDPAYFDRTPPKQVQRLEREQKEVARRVEELMREWEKAEEELAVLASA